jgi:hypothetical protein
MCKFHVKTPAAPADEHVDQGLGGGAGVEAGAYDRTIVRLS